MCWLLNQVLRAQGDGLSHSTGRKRVAFPSSLIPKWLCANPVCHQGSPAGRHCWMLRARLVPEGPSA